MTYKPGQVAMVAAANRREEYRAFFDGQTWRELGCHAFCVNSPTTVRPLVVLDWHPSPTHLDDLLGLLREHYWTSLADQIEAQTRPAIEEPKGLGAVVEDADGNCYVRGHGAINPWGGPSIFKQWHEVDAVRVVWAGVQS